MFVLADVENCNDLCSVFTLCSSSSETLGDGVMASVRAFPSSSQFPLSHLASPVHSVHFSCIISLIFLVAASIYQNVSKGGRLNTSFVDIGIYTSKSEYLPPKVVPLGDCVYHLRLLITLG